MDFQEVKRFRLIFVGDSSVGKTSIISRYLDPSTASSTVPTIGVAYNEIKLTLGGSNIVVEIWDTAGQETYRSLIPSFYQRATGAIFVFDVCSRESFTNLNYWINSFWQYNSRDVPIIIAGNKIDLTYERIISDDEAHLYSTSKNCSYVMCSAKGGLAIDLLFQAIIEKMASTGKKSNTSNLLKDPEYKKAEKCC